jgi:DNA polymerase-3 subunit beta
VRIRAERDDLADVLARAGRAVGARSALPILQGLLCQVSGRTLVVTGTDTEVTIRTNLEVEVLEEGRTVVPAKLAAEAVRKLPAGAVAMTAADGEVEITGNGPRFRLREMSVDDYPQLPEVAAGNGIEIDGDLMAKALSQVGVAASSDEGRPTLTGILFEGNEESLRLVATDSYRLAVRDLPAVAAPSTTLVPYRALRELGRTVGEPKLTMAFDEREAVFASGRGQLTVRIIESNYPNYRQLLPDSYPNRLTVSKEGLLDAVARASLVAEDHIPVRLSLHQGGVELSVSRQEVGEETEHLAGEYSGDDIIIAFNTRYLTDGVNAVDSDEIVLETSDALKPGLLHGTGDDAFRYLLMPVRL